MYEQSQKYKNLALFDFDGTLCRKDSFTGFIFYTLSKRHIAKRGLRILPWIQAYYLNRYPADKMRSRLFHSMFRNISTDYLQDLALNYRTQLLAQLDPEMLLQLRQHQLQGDDVVIVSASIDVYLQPLSQYLGVDLICTETQIIQQHYTGFYRSPDCSCEQKSLRVQQRYDLENYHAIYAYGNTEEDRAMLDLADYSFMVGKDLHLPNLNTTQQYAI